MHNQKAVKAYARADKRATGAYYQKVVKFTLGLGSMTWENNLDKGRGGEQIIRDMLKESGYQVIPYGFETIPLLVEQLWKKRRMYRTRKTD